MLRLDQEGLSVQEIAAEMGISPASVRRILGSYRQSCPKAPADRVARSKSSLRTCRGTSRVRETPAA
jgi:predicted transcriptional regulator